MKVDKRRMVLALLVMSGVFVLFAGRLFWLQLVASDLPLEGGRPLTEASVRQREMTLTLDAGRADFTDRRLTPLTGRTIRALAVFPARIPDGAGHRNAENRLAAVLGLDGRQWQDYVDALPAPALYQPAGSREPYALTDGQAAEIARLPLQREAVVTVRLRYDDRTIARQLIGFVNENPEAIARKYAREVGDGAMSVNGKIGASGLERTWDPLLQGGGGKTVSLLVDGSGRPLQAPRLQTNGGFDAFHPLLAVTTLDADIQRGIEQAADRRGLQEGAVVVLDARNADVIAMVSRPNFDGRQVDPASGRWRNRALAAIPPGSTFKTAIAAAALEEGIVAMNTRFHCNGQLGRYGFSCWKPDGHGTLTFREAFAESCNITFALVAERLGGETIARYAQGLGLARTVGWTGDIPGVGGSAPQLDHEDAGQVFAPDTSREDDGAIVQTAIGQRDVRMTPLQGANLVVTLLHNGQVYEPRVVREIRYRNQHTKTAFPVQKLPSAPVISGRTARLVRQAMEDTVEDGTARSLRQAAWPAAGKTGTAQLQAGGQSRENQWFIGYAPVDSPRYAIAVVAENRPSGSASQALAIARDTIDLLAAQRAR